jgi:uncharacterized membrane protein YeaQ/YmgE (transglycosylase-associated protein family)
MNILIYLVVAAVIGWIATDLMHDRSLLINTLLLFWVHSWQDIYLARYFTLERSTRQSLFPPCL